MTENNVKQVVDYMEQLEKLNNEMKFHDPYKWLYKIEEIEEMDETIENLENETDRLFEAVNPGNFIGSNKEYKIFVNRVKNRIEYLTTCIEILQDTRNEMVENELMDFIETEKEQELIKNEEILNFKIANNFLEDGEDY